LFHFFLFYFFQATIASCGSAAAEGQQQPSHNHAMDEEADNHDDDDYDDDWAPTPIEELRRRAMPPQPPANSSSTPSPQQLQDMQEQLRQFQMQLQQQQKPSASNNHKILHYQHKSDSDDNMSTDTNNSRPQQQQQQLPSTVMPPTVMASVLPGQQQQQPSHLSTTQKPAIRRRQGAKSSRVESPQDVFERMLSLRGYVAPGNLAALRIKASDSNYDTTPTPLQLASFGTALVKAIHHSDVPQLSALLSTGLSPNPCNQFRDSIVDLVVKRANAPVFCCLVQHGCDLRVCDGFGRTPLHHCCWASEFCPEIAWTILQTDPQQLLMQDSRGQTPLEYVRDGEPAAQWIAFLEERAVPQLFPTGGSLPPTVSLAQRGGLPDPPHALPPPLARAVSSGNLTPEEVARMDPATRARFAE